MTQALISIIVPCYNVEKFISNTLESVYLQTYEHWECILIDDGSKDNTAATCLNWCKKDSRFKYFHQENKGLSSARNAGLKQANGAFIYFFDSDDLIASFTLENLITLINEDIDIVFGKCAVTEGQNSNIKDFLQHSPTSLKIYTNNSKSLLSLAIEEPFICVAWNRLYRKSFLIDYRLEFKKGLLHEDELWFFETLFYAKGITFNDKPTYFYNVSNADSITNNFSLKNLEAYLYIIEYIYSSYYCNTELENDKEIISAYLIHLKTVALNHCFNKLNPEEKRKATILIQDSFYKTLSKRTTKILCDEQEKLQYNFKLVEFLEAKDIVAYLRYYNSSTIFRKLKSIIIRKKANAINKSKNRRIKKVF